MSLQLRKSNLGLRTEQAKRSLVQYIWDLKLKAGERIPPYEQFRAKLGVGDATIRRAIRALEEDGVLATRPKVGTYVVDPRADGHMARTIGILAHQEEGMGPFFPCLLHYLHLRFNQAGCETRLFYQRPDTIRGYSTVKVDFFPGLERCIKHGLLHGVIVMTGFDTPFWQKFEDAKLDPCFLGASLAAPRGVYIDYATAVESAIADLIRAGCRRPGLVIAPGATHEFVWPAFSRALSLLRSADPRRLDFTGESIAGGRQVAHAILARPPAERPDGLAIMDDQMALGLFSELTRNGAQAPAYDPVVVCWANKQIPLDFPIRDMIRYEVDIEELAGLVVDTVTQRFLGGITGPDHVWLKPRRVVEGREAPSVQLPQSKCRSLLKVSTST